jgi:hypothetical protein
MAVVIFLFIKSIIAEISAADTFIARTAGPALRKMMVLAYEYLQLLSKRLILIGKVISIVVLSVNVAFAKNTKESTNSCIESLKRQNLSDKLKSDFDFIAEARSNFKSNSKRADPFDFKMPGRARNELSKAIKLITSELKLLAAKKSNPKTSKTQQRLLSRHIKLLNDEKAHMKTLLARKNSTYWEYVETMLWANTYFGLFVSIDDSTAYKNHLDSIDKEAGEIVDLISEKLTNEFADEKEFNGLYFITSDPQDAEDLFAVQFTGLPHIQIVLRRSDLSQEYETTTAFTRHDIYHGSSGVEKFRNGYRPWIIQFGNFIDKIKNIKLQKAVAIYLFDWFHERNGTISDFSEYISDQSNSRFDVQYSFSSDGQELVLGFFEESEINTIFPRAIKELMSYLQSHPLN